MRQMPPNLSGLPVTTTPAIVMKPSAAPLTTVKSAHLPMVSSQMQQALTLVLRPLTCAQDGLKKAVRSLKCARELLNGTILSLVRAMEMPVKSLLTTIKLTVSNECIPYQV